MLNFSNLFVYALVWPGPKSNSQAHELEDGGWRMENRLENFNDSCVQLWDEITNHAEIMTLEPHIKQENVSFFLGGSSANQSSWVEQLSRIVRKSYHIFIEFLKKVIQKNILRLPRIGFRRLHWLYMLAAERNERQWEEILGSVENPPAKHLKDSI